MAQDSIHGAAQDSIHGAAHYTYGRNGQFGEVFIVAADVMAPDDVELRQVLDEMSKQLRSVDPTLTFQVGRLKVSVRPSLGGGLAALRAAADQLASMHGTGVTPD